MIASVAKVPGRISIVHAMKILFWGRLTCWWSPALPTALNSFFIRVPRSGFPSKLRLFYSNRRPFWGSPRPNLARNVQYHCSSWASDVNVTLCTSIFFGRKGWKFSHSGVFLPTWPVKLLYFYSCVICDCQWRRLIMWMFKFKQTVLESS